tara:strand:+ start:5 stop:4183 length:4179 start_codon:yes stop_codon:yes gene_type:complete
MVDIYDSNAHDAAEQYNQIQKFRQRYEGSKQEESVIDKVAFENQRADDAELEIEKANKGQDGFLESAFEVVPDVLTGFGRAAEEVSQSIGGPEKIFNFNPPDDTASHMIQSFSQFAGPFALGVGPVARVSSAVNFFQKHKSIKSIFDAMVAGLPVDAFAFDPQDGNMFNFLITTLGVSEDSRAGAAIKEYLAVSPEDSDMKARAKNALTGVIGSVMFDMIIKTLGGTIKTGHRAAKNIIKGDVQLLDPAVPHADEMFSGKTQTDGTAPSPSELQTPEVRTRGAKASTSEVKGHESPSDDEIKAVTDELGDDYVEVLDRAQLEMTPEELAFVGSKFPDKEVAEVRAVDKAVSDGAEYYHSSPPEVQAQMREIFEKAYNGEKLSDIELDAMNPFNIAKLNSPTERLQLIAQMGEIMKGSLPRNIDDAAKAARKELLDQEIQKQIKFFGVDPETFLKNLQKAAPTVEGQFKFLRAGKTFTDMQIQKALREVGKSVVARTKKARQSADAYMLNAMAAARATSGLNTSFGRGLAELKNIADAGDLASQTNLIKANIVNDIITSTPELGAKRDGILTNLERLSKLERESSPETFAKVRKQRTEEELTVSNIKRLEKQLADLKSGKEPKPKRESSIVEKRLKKEIKALKKAAPRKVRTDEELAEANIKRIQTRIKDLKSGKTKTKNKRELTELEESLLAEEKALRAEKRITEVLSANDLQARQRLRFMELSMGAKTRDILMEVYINGLLSSIKTSVVNFTGNTTATFSSILERAYAGLTSDSIDGVTLGEAAQLTWSYLTSQGDFWRTFWYASKHGPSTNAIKNDLITVHNQSISGELLGIGGNLGKAMNGVGWAVNLPGRMLLSMDEAFKMVHYRAQIDALSYRKARKIVGEGANKHSLALKHKEIKNDVLNHKDILEEAKSYSELNTFTNHLPEIDHFDVKTGKRRQIGGLSRTFKRLIDRDRTGLMRVFIPFFQTPVNLLSWAGQRTPFLRRFSDSLKRDLASDNIAIKQLAEARVATGNMMWATTIGLAMTGNFTGAPPADARLRKQQEDAMGGSFWYSYLTEDGWVKYDRFDPLGIMMAGSANMFNLIRSIVDLTGQGNRDGYTAELMDAFNQTYADAVVGTIRLVTDRHYLQGFGNLIDLLTGDSRGFSRGAASLVTALDPTASFYSSFRRNFNKGINPETETPLKQAEREVKDPLTAGWNDMAIVLNNMFENSQSLLFGGGTRPPARNHMGEVKFYPGTTKSDELQLDIWNSIQSLSNPFAGGKRAMNPVMHKLASLGSTLLSPAQWEEVKGVKLDQEEHTHLVDVYVALNKAQNLEKWVKSKAYNRMPEAMQLDMLENRLKLNRSIAEVKTSGKFKRLRDAGLKNDLNNIRQSFAKNLPQRSQQSLFNIGN